MRLILRRDLASPWNSLLQPTQQKKETDAKFEFKSATSSEILYNFIFLLFAKYDSLEGENKARWSLL